MLTALSVLAGSMIACAQGGPSGGGQHVAVSLIGETRNVVPGQPLNVALRQQIAPGWHTYWRNPGESGLPTTIDWSLPTGFTAGPIQWPTPERFVVDPVVGYGYHDDVLLPVTIAVPANLRSGTTVSLSAHVSWLACSDICIPEEADLRIAMPVGTVLQPDPDTADAFAAARARMPSANPFPTTATVAKDDIILHVAAGDATRLRDVAFYPADENVIDESTPQSVAADSEGLVLTLRRDTSQARAVSTAFWSSAIRACRATASRPRSRSRRRCRVERPSGFAHQIRHYRDRRARRPVQSQVPRWATWTNPIAISTRSAGRVNSVPGTSCICQPFGPATQSTVQPCRWVTRPAAQRGPSSVQVQRRWQPSSWEEEVRMIFGQKGHGVSGLYSFGRLGEDFELRNGEGLLADGRAHAIAARVAAARANTRGRRAA